MDLSLLLKKLKASDLSIGISFSDWEFSFDLNQDTFQVRILIFYLHWFTTYYEDEEDFLEMNTTFGTDDSPFKEHKD